MDSKMNRYANGYGEGAFHYPGNLPLTNHIFITTPFVIRSIFNFEERGSGTWRFVTVSGSIISQRRDKGIQMSQTLRIANIFPYTFSFPFSYINK